MARWSVLAAAYLVAAGLHAQECGRIDKDALAQRLGAGNEVLASVLKANAVEVQKLPTPFLRRGAIYRVQANLPTHPAVYHIGCTASATVVLGGNPTGFVELARQAGLTLDHPDARSRYAAVFLETTLVAPDTVQVVRSFDDLLRLPNPAPAEVLRLEAVRRRYQAGWAPTSGSGPPWTVRVYGVRRRDLIEFDVTITATGEIGVTERAVERDLPIGFRG